MNEKRTALDAEKEQPREKLLRVGSEALTDKELLMLIIGTGSANKSLENVSLNVLSKLDKNPELDVNELMLVPGMGCAKASAIIAALELGRRKVTLKPRSITTPMDIYKEVLHFSSRDQEHFITIMLNGAHEVIDSFISTIGLLNKTIVHPREVFAPAIKNRAAAIAIAHNHPSGSLEPSEEDKQVTMRLINAGEILGIRVIDHIVFSSRGYYSFLEHSLI